MELIVFDLDGTLLNASSEVTPFTRETLALLAQKNIAYTVATGRTLHSAQAVLAGTPFPLPHVYNNGAVVFDPASKKLALDCLLTMAECSHVIRAAQQVGVAPFVSTLNRDQQPTIFYTDLVHESEQKLLAFFKTRTGLQLKHLSELSQDYFITNVNMIGDAGLIEAVEHSIADEAHLVAYSGLAFEGDNTFWLDINHSSATKGGAVKLLKQQLNVEKVICFGDGENDLSLFELADESYAPENAKDSVKDAATAVIGHHDQEGIAHFLRDRFGLI